MSIKTCLVIAGPTGIGKTSAAIEVAQYFHTEIISADSRQCFRELNIGVAKPTAAELQLVPHHFIDSHNINETVTAADFERYAVERIANIFERSDIAVVCGGTGLYLKAFCEGLDDIPSIDPAIKADVIVGYEQNGLSWLQSEVRRNDPVYWNRGETENPQRLMRALEVLRSTGRSITSFQSGVKKRRDFSMVKFVLDMPRALLYERINNRVDQMRDAGLEAEATALYDLRALNALQTVGYSEIFSALDGDISMDEAFNLIKQHSRNYAKRQITWFRKVPEMIAVPAGTAASTIINYIESRR